MARYAYAGEREKAAREKKQQVEGAAQGTIRQSIDNSHDT